jgi:hypothetical protein
MFPNSLWSLIFSLGLLIDLFQSITIDQALSFL